MIISFRDKETKKDRDQIYAKKLLKDIQRAGFRKLIILYKATDFEDLRSPPGNRLEQLSGDREGQYSIRFNNQWSICFIWSQSQVSDVEYADYH